MRSLVAVDEETGERLWLLRAAGEDCRIQELDESGVLRRQASVSCGDRIVQLEDRLLVVDETSRSTAEIDLSSFEPKSSSLVDAYEGWTLEWRDEGLLLRGADGELPLPLLRQARILSDGSVIGISPTDSGETLVRYELGAVRIDLLNDPGIIEIESWDVEPREGQLVFAAELSDGRMDVGIAATDASAMRWLPAEPGDEYRATWAPRGNKVTWLIDSPAGVVMRSVHIPTGYQLSVPFGFVQIDSVAWEPDAEKVFLVTSSPLASPSVVSIRYGGEDRMVVVDPEQRIERSGEPLPGIPGAVVLAPARVQYGHTYPVVVITGNKSSGWDARFAEAAKDAAGAVVWVPESDETTIESARSALAQIGWVDPARISIISRE